MINLASVVMGSAVHVVTVSRFNQDTFDTHGRSNARTVAATLTIRMSVQPVKDDLDREAQGGFNNSGRVRVFAAEALQMRDRLSVPGMGYYEIDSVENWIAVSGYCAATAKQLQTPSEPR